HISLPIAPVAKDGVESITYTDSTGAQQVLAPSQYVVKTAGYSVCILSAVGAVWPAAERHAPEPVVIRFKVGEGVSDIGENIKAAIKLIVGHLYENRENVTVDASRGVAIELPQGAQSLLMSELW